MLLTKSQSEYLEGLAPLATSEAEEADWRDRWLSIAAKARVACRDDHLRDGKSATA